MYLVASFFFCTFSQSRDKPFDVPLCGAGCLCRPMRAVTYYCNKGLSSFSVDSAADLFSHQGVFRSSTNTWKYCVYTAVLGFAQHVNVCYVDVS